MAQEPLTDSWLTQEFRSESTLPLLNFLLQSSSDQTPETLADTLHSVTAGVGKDDTPIPDESEQVKVQLLKLMKDGPGKVTGSPTVSLQSSVNVVLLNELGHYCGGWRIRSLCWI